MPVGPARALRCTLHCTLHCTMHCTLRCTMRGAREGSVRLYSVRHALRRSRPGRGPAPTTRPEQQSHKVGCDLLSNSRLVPFFWNFRSHTVRPPYSLILSQTSDFMLLLSGQNKVRRETGREINNVKQKAFYFGK